ncbi:hypothetical protein M885DRAFT_613226 [Pelagophyceae sp. CCMP2097]|nr:hypothetical protein M885DRAFT_613226 [Pelagophyceae sp. CCMP2097]
MDEPIVLKRKRGGKKARQKHYAEEHYDETSAAAPTAFAAPAAYPSAEAASATPEAEDGSLPKRRRGGKNRHGAEADGPPPSTRDASLDDPDKLPCSHFAAGTCTRGDKCRFSHVDGGAVARGRQGAQARNKKKDWQLTHAWQQPQGAEPYGDGGGEVPDCKGHSEPCVRRVVEKVGAHTGRAFYSCSRWNKKAETCGFFKWEDAL